MSSNFGKKIKIQIFGQSHSEALGVVIDGLEAGHIIDTDKIQVFLDRRKGGKNAYSTKRREDDTPHIVSGLVDGKTCGAPLCAIFYNKDTKPVDYKEIFNIPRPSHADYNAYVKYNGANDVSGGGHFSGRLTLPLCFAGAVCQQILEKKGIYIGAHISSIASIKDTPYNPISLTKANLLYDAFPVNDSSTGEKMVELMTKTALEGDSLGGTIECAIIGVPQGVGEPMFDGIENRLSSIVFGVPAVKGIEFGAGFAATEMKGSQNNDEYFVKDGQIKLKTNNAGGILGGIATGAPIIFRVAIKPTPSIAKKQSSVDVKTLENVTLQIKGRHDPCIVPRAVPCIEAAAAIAMLDMI